MAAWPTDRRRWRRARRLPALNLALQGGGAHGAFTWGALDRLLEEDGFACEGISGTSAGALNAVVLASGWLAGGAQGAREALAGLWREIAALSRFSPLRAGGLSQMAADFTAQLLSPYQLNPLGLNPLRRILGQLVDFERLRAARSLKLFVAATNLGTGQARIFESHELCADAVLASACLPQLHQAVAIEGELYWDGGFVSNPPLIPLVERCRARDLLLIRINPALASGRPKAARDIRNRIAEIVFERPLAAELAMLGELSRRARSPLRWLSPSARRLARHRRHVIDGGPVLAALDPVSKVDPDWARVGELRDLGRRAAAVWLAEHGGAGERRAPLARSTPGAAPPRAAADRT